MKPTKSHIIRTAVLIAKHNGTTLQAIARKYGINRMKVHSSILNYNTLPERHKKALAESMKVSPEVLSAVAAGEMDFLEYLRKC
jgi:cyanate lyase